MTDKQSVGPQSALRKIGEDNLLRPFLSGLFDPHAYVKNVIRDGKSEECFNAIVEAVESINDEIKRYISQHKVSLCGCLCMSVARSDPSRRTC